MARKPHSTVQVTSKLEPAALMEAIINDPLPSMFVRWGPFPAVTRVELTDEKWQVGSRRLVHTSDGNKMAEQFMQREAEESFDYKLTDLEGLFGWLVARIDDMWDFDELAAGCRVTWTWEFTPHPGRGLLVVPFVLLWQVYASKILRASVRRLEAQELGQGRAAC